MSNTQDYFQNVQNFRRELGEAWSTYESKMAGIARYQGSAGYDEQAAQYADERDKTINETQRAHAARFDEILKSMREHVYNKAMIPPTQEQLALLTALKMREKISKDELAQAGRTLKDSPVALSVLAEIAEKMEYHTLHFSVESTSSILAHVDSLADSARRLCKLDKPNSRREQMARASIYSPSHVPHALDSYRVDRDFSNERDLMANYGNVTDFDTFASCVNYSE